MTVRVAAATSVGGGWTMLLLILLLLVPQSRPVRAWVMEQPKGALHSPRRRTSNIVHSSSSTSNAAVSSLEEEDEEPRGRLILVPRDGKDKAYPQQTPHSGRHFYPSHPAYQKRRRGFFFRKNNVNNNKRFTEGWYYRLTLPKEQGNVSFAFIVSVEDPGHVPPSPLRLACIQIIGPNDGYLVQADADDSKFWAWQHQQGLGCTFSYKQPATSANVNETTTATTTRAATTRAAMCAEEWKDRVESGFQILPTHFLGRIQGHDGSLGGVLAGQGLPGSCDFDFHIQPLCGWGDNVDEDVEQKSTGGWLSRFAVLEPHWQVTLADARATGSVTWKNQTFQFTNAPFYAEKNWGAALPSKWYWTQCNSFDGYDQLSVTAGGGIRQIPLGHQEALGMVSVHYNGRFYEGVPWSGAMEWKAAWGNWELKGNSTYGKRPFEALVTYTCNTTTTPGLVFRAPTPDRGMVYFCRDTFEAKTSLTLWELEYNTDLKQFIRKAGPPLIDNATSHQGGAEIGGGPWWEGDEWKGESRVKQPIKALLQLPFRIQAMRRRIRSILQLQKRKQ